MGSFLDKPKCEKHEAQASGNGLTYSLCSMQGWRLEMEDAHTCRLSLPEGLSKWSFFAVFDGHAGAKVAEEASKLLIDDILDQKYFKEELRPNPEICNRCTYDCDKISQAIKDAFLVVDAKFRALDYTSGSTAVGVMITPKHFFYINCGDSRAVHVRTGSGAKHQDYQSAIDKGHFGQEPRINQRGPPDGEQMNVHEDAPPVENGYSVFFSTKDHKPIDQEERERIERAGGMVIIQRINGALAVSRALGDFEYKRIDDLAEDCQLVSPVPEITVIERSKPDSEFQDAYAIVACDGIYDAISNDNLQIFSTHKLKVGLGPQNVASETLDLCLNLGSRDNMSLIFLTFNNCPEKDQSMYEKECEWDNQLVKVIKQLNDEGELSKMQKDTTEWNIDQLADQVYHELLNTDKLKQIYGDYIFGGSVINKKDLIKTTVENLRAQSMTEGNNQ